MRGLNPDIENLVKEARAGNRRAVSKCITLVENGGPEAYQTLRGLRGGGNGGADARTARRIGITGPPGSGKSTLVNRLAAFFAEAGDKVGIIAVDPSSPFSGGAILGDRVRMDMPSGKAEIFFRSMGSRGAFGGLSNACESAISVLEACGYDPILLETVGVGQSEVEIIRYADTVVVVQAPGLGDEIQSIKAGILEIGDIYAVNKCDLPGSDRTAHELRASLAAPVLMVSAMSGEGIEELVKSINMVSSASKQKKQLKENGLKMNTLKIDHIGIAVKNINDSLAFYENTLGIKGQGIEEVAEQKVKVAFLPCGDSELELLESTEEDGPVAKFIEKNGEGVQHIAIRVDNIENALAELKEKGIRLIDESPRYGAGGASIAFVHPKATNGVLLELCERK